MSEEKKLDEKKLEEVAGGVDVGEDFYEFQRAMSFHDSWTRDNCDRCALFVNGCPQPSNPTDLYHKFSALHTTHCPDYIKRV